MGRKRTRAREFIYLCTAGLIISVLFSCASVVKTDKVELKLEEIPREKIQTEDLGTEKIPKEEVKKEDPRTEQIPKEKVQKEDPRTEEPPRLLWEHLLRAKRRLEQRDFEGSLKESQKILSLSSQTPPADEALFNMGLIYAHSGNPKKDYGKSIGFFRKLLKEHPHSPLAEQARIWSGILQENEKFGQTIQRLNQVIEESKVVDIEIEEKKREKAK